MHDRGIADSDIFYFVIMVRHGVHVIFTQMVSTHEAMVQGTLDFPNLISLKNITQDFVIDVEIYGMVSCLSFLFISCLFTLHGCPERQPDIRVTATVIYIAPSTGRPRMHPKTIVSVYCMLYIFLPSVL